MNSSVRLGVSPAAASTPRGVFSQRFEALFPRAGALGCVVCFAPRCLSRFIYAQMWVPWVLPATLPAQFSGTLSLALWFNLCANVGPQSLLVVRPPAPLVPHSTVLVWVPSEQRESSPPRLPVSDPPTGLDECLFFISFVWDFLAVRFSVSSGCVRRCSVSTYASILVISLFLN